MKYVYAAESYLTRDVMISHCYLHEDGHNRPENRAR